MQPCGTPKLEQVISNLDVATHSFSRQWENQNEARQRQGLTGLPGLALYLSQYCHRAKMGAGQGLILLFSPDSRQTREGRNQKWAIFPALLKNSVNCVNCVKSPELSGVRSVSHSDHSVNCVIAWARIGRDW